MVCMILPWLGVGNVLSITLPSGDEPIRQRRQDGSLKQFIIAFVVSYLIGYLVNAMLIWRVFAAQELADRLGSAIIPGIVILLSSTTRSSTTRWILLTVLAVALSQPPEAPAGDRRNAEMKVFEQEAAQGAAAARRRTETSGTATGST